RPGFEDTFYYLWRERRLPVNVDPFDSQLEDPLERDRLRRVFENGLSQVIGYVLPLRAGWEHGRLRWTSGPWFLRDERMYLIPGDSAMGYRLPLDSLPWTLAGERAELFPRDPMAPREALAPRAQFSRRGPIPLEADARRGAGASSAPRLGQSAGD